MFYCIFGSTTTANASSLQYIRVLKFDIQISASKARLRNLST